LDRVFGVMDVPAETISVTSQHSDNEQNKKNNSEKANKAESGTKFSI
jgi:hypothetical protein